MLVRRLQFCRLAETAYNHPITLGLKYTCQLLRLAGMLLE